ncbi:hypothetical protein BLA29_001454 [Euroglyphus maynei]|uniref:Uncharacterized protein n=1 Tax=Euroglyphus maynei TaxID=6958 RepID=A0A1Y3B4B2_EURMA|nr:hypothetical protein BLA29_001454 [Euroglyphus maynei]
MTPLVRRIFQRKISPIDLDIGKNNVINMDYIMLHYHRQCLDFFVQDSSCHVYSMYYVWQPVI